MDGNSTSEPPPHLPDRAERYGVGEGDCFGLERGEAEEGLRQSQRHLVEANGVTREEERPEAKLPHLSQASYLCTCLGPGGVERVGDLI